MHFSKNHLLSVSPWLLMDVTFFCCLSVLADQPLLETLWLNFTKLNGLSESLSRNEAGFKFICTLVFTQFKLTSLLTGTGSRALQKVLLSFAISRDQVVLSREKGKPQFIMLWDKELEDMEERNLRPNLNRCWKYKHKVRGELSPKMCWLIHPRKDKNPNQKPKYETHVCQ